MTSPLRLDARRLIRGLTAVLLLAAAAALPAACSSPKCGGKCTAPDAYCFYEEHCGDGLSPCDGDELCLPLPASCNGTFSCDCVEKAHAHDCPVVGCGTEDYNYLTTSCG